MKCYLIFSSQILENGDYKYFLLRLSPSCHCIFVSSSGTSVTCQVLTGLVNQLLLFSPYLFSSGALSVLILPSRMLATSGAIVFLRQGEATQTPKWKGGQGLIKEH